MANNNILKPDFCVIGGGSAGLSFAAAALALGASVVLVERGKMGGDCLNYGCVPSKALISAAKKAHLAKEATKYGLSLSNKIDYKKIYQHIHHVIGAIAPHDSVKRFEEMGAKVIKASAKFIDEATLKAGKYEVRPSKFIIATGSHPFIPPIVGLSEVKYQTNETIFDLKSLPEELIVIGGGPIGVELAQSFQRLGSKVTILEAFKVLPKDDQELTATLIKQLKKEGVKILEAIEIENICYKGKKIAIEYKQNSSKKTIKGTELLVSAGRRPNLDGLNLDKSGVEYNQRGIIVDDYLKTKNKKIYAAGDCIGSLQFTHSASYHASLAIRRTIFGFGKKLETRFTPWVTYCDPEIAHVGYNKDMLNMQKIKHQEFSVNFTENDRAQAEERLDGQIKIYVTRGGKILGVSIVGSCAGELILPWVMAIQHNINVTKIAELIAPYPTFSEVSKRVAGQFLKNKLDRSPALKWLIKWLHSWQK